MDKFIEKHINLFKEAYETYVKEFKQHSIEERYKKEPSKYQSDIDGMKAVEISYKRIYIENKSLNIDEANNLYKTAEVLIKELNKYDVVMIKKNELKYWNYIIVLKMIASYYIGKNSR